MYNRTNRHTVGYVIRRTAKRAVVWVLLLRGESWSLFSKQRPSEIFERGVDNSTCSSSSWEELEASKIEGWRPMRRLLHYSKQEILRDLTEGTWETKRRWMRHWRPCQERSSRVWCLGRDGRGRGTPSNGPLSFQHVSYKYDLII